MTNEDFMLTTFDNTFNPFTEFEAWFKEDHRLGHNTCELLDLLSATSDISSDELQERDIQFAMDEIVNRFPMIYKKVSNSDYKEQED